MIDAAHLLPTIAQRFYKVKESSVLRLLRIIVTRGDPENKVCLRLESVKEYGGVHQGARHVHME